MGKLKIHASLQESLPEAEILRKNWSWYLESTSAQWYLPATGLPCFSHSVHRPSTWSLHSEYAA